MHSCEAVPVGIAKYLYHEDGHREKLQCTHYILFNLNHIFVTKGIFNCTSGLANFYTSVQVHFVKFIFKVHFRST